MIVWYDKSAVLQATKPTTAQAAIDSIDSIILALLGAQAATQLDPSLQEYGYDDGQTKVRRTFNSPRDIPKAIEAWETLKQMYVNRLNGRVFRNVDSKNMPRYCR